MPSNPGVVRQIDAQGLAGRLTTVNVGDVAHRAVDRALAGRNVYVPGALNQALRHLGALMPPRLVATVVDRRWRKSSQAAQRALGTLARDGI
jgi:hypothetical protein